jgi:hypothetical protein
VPYSQRRNRHSAGLARFNELRDSQAHPFYSMAPRRDWRAILDADSIASKLPSDRAYILGRVVRDQIDDGEPVTAELHRACTFYESPWPYRGANCRREIGPHPLVVLALARRRWPRRAGTVRDVAAWAVWTYCQIERRGKRGRWYWLDYGDGRTKVRGEAVGIYTRSDLLQLDAFAATFRGRVQVHRAIERVDELLKRAEREGISTPVS